MTIKKLHLLIIIISGMLISACGGGNGQKHMTSNNNLPSLNAADTVMAVEDISGPTIKITDDKKITKIIIEPIIVDDDPQQFINLDIFQLAKLLGAPVLVRRDTMVEVWQYKGRACVLDIFLYKINDIMKVQYVDLHGDKNHQKNRQCMAEILRQHIRYMS